MRNLRFYTTIFESTVQDGPMSIQKQFYSDDMSKQNRKENLLKRRLSLGEKKGFNGKRIIIPSQNCNQNGTYTVINEKTTDGYDDLWDLDIPSDIFLLEEKTKSIALAYPVADCPVLIAEDTQNKVTALTHCGAEFINRELPIDLIKSLEQHTNAKKEDIILYMSSCADVEHYTYDNYPSWATNKAVWKHHIFKDNGYYHIDLRGSVLEQLENYRISKDQITVNPKDTITNPTLYSNSATYHNIPNKNGRFLVGCFYKEEEKPKTYQRTK